MISATTTPTPIAPSRRRFLQGSLLTGAAALAGPALLSACGSGDIVSALNPKRIIVMGDGLSYLGTQRYTINVTDGSINNWAAQVAASYGVAVSDVAAGGTGYAQGLATVLGTTTSVESQITAFLATGGPRTDDLVLINAPMQDILGASASASDRATSGTSAGTALAVQVRRLIAAGAKNVVVINVYDLGKSPLAIALGQQTPYSTASSNFNKAFLIETEDIKPNLFVIELRSYIDRVVATPTSFIAAPRNVTGAACTTPDGTTCTPSTLVADALAGAGDGYLFADNLHPTPVIHRLFGAVAYNAIRGRY
jgi:phospholipase/lecithinase/hemolysin